MATQNQKMVKVIDYNLSVSELSVENIKSVIDLYIQSNSHSLMSNSGFPLILNLHISKNRTSESTRMFQSELDSATPVYKGYNDDGTIAPMDVCIQLPIFPAPFENEMIAPLYEAINTNYRQFENIKLELAQYIKNKGIQDKNVLFDLDKMRDAIIEFSVFRTLQSQDNCNTYYHDIINWCSTHYPEYMNPLYNYFQNNLDYVSDKLINNTKFMAYGSVDMVNNLSEIGDRKDEAAVDAQINNLSAVLMEYTKIRLAEYYRWLNEMSYLSKNPDDNTYSSALMQSLPIGDVYTSAHHLEIADCIQRSGFFSSSPLDSILYPYKPNSSKENENQFYENIYTNKKFAEILLRIIKVYGAGGTCQRQYCDELSELEDDLPKPTHRSEAQPDNTSPKKHGLRNLFNKLFNPDNPSSGDENNGNSPKRD